MATIVSASSTSKPVFSKQASTESDLLTKWMGQGLAVNTPAEQDRALTYLKFVGGYRLKGYWAHLIDPTTKKFPAGFSFDDLITRYEFDRELRAITMGAIDKLEVAIRVTISDTLSIVHSPHWFQDIRVFKTIVLPRTPAANPPKDFFTQLNDKLVAEVNRAKDKAFVIHYFDHYSSPNIPPSCSTSECVSFGTWSQVYKNLNRRQDRNEICKQFGVVSDMVFESWIHTLTVLRNLVAHNSRLLGVTLRLMPKNYRAEKITFPSGNHRVYSAATVINYLLTSTGIPHEWIAQLSNLFAKYPTIKLSEVGFPSTWETEPGWA